MGFAFTRPRYQVSVYRTIGPLVGLPLTLPHLLSALHFKPFNAYNLFLFGNENIKCWYSFFRYNIRNNQSGLPRSLIFHLLNLLLQCVMFESKPCYLTSSNSYDITLSYKLNYFITPV